MREKRLHELDEQLLFAMDEKGHNVHLTDQGLDILSPDDPEAFIVPDLSEVIHQVEEDPDLSIDEKREKRAELEREYAEKSEKIHVIHQLLKAYALFHKDEQYVVQDGQIVIVDEFTGRMMPGAAGPTACTRRWRRRRGDREGRDADARDGHDPELLPDVRQARRHDGYGGDGGGRVPPDLRSGRDGDPDQPSDHPGRPSRSGLPDEAGEVQRDHRRDRAAERDAAAGAGRYGQRRRVGDAVADAEAARDPHEVLNAKYHGREAQIVAEAGQPGAVTIATNMAGRGTDIKLGPGVKETRTEESRRRDGRGDGGAAHHRLGAARVAADRPAASRPRGRQGDPGATQFFLSLEDDLMRLFGSDRIAGVMTKMGAEEGEVITHPLITSSIGNAQKRVEMQNFEARKRLLDYDDVMNQQREVIYDLRTFALEGGRGPEGRGVGHDREDARSARRRARARGHHPEEWELCRAPEPPPARLLPHRRPAAGGGGGAHDFDSVDELRDYLFELARGKFERAARGSSGSTPSRCSATSC
jgi:preprotein translocase subunit SecA